MTKTTNRLELPTGEIREQLHVRSFKTLTLIEDRFSKSMFEPPAGFKKMPVYPSRSDDDAESLKQAGISGIGVPPDFSPMAEKKPMSLDRLEVRSIIRRTLGWALYNEGKH